MRSKPPDVPGETLLAHDERICAWLSECALIYLYRGLRYRRFERRTYALLVFLLLSVAPFLRHV